MKTRSAPLFQQFSEDLLSGFLIVISPPENVLDYVNSLKAEFYEKYGPFESRYSKPHISICNFPLLEKREKKVFSSLQKDLSQIDPFLLELNGFGNFVKSNVIYLNVKESENLESLKSFFRRKGAELWLGKKFNVVDNHHLTIAKKLKPGIFEIAKTDYLSSRYQSTFLVDRLKVLRYDLDARRYFVFRDLKLGE